MAILSSYFNFLADIDSQIKLPVVNHMVNKRTSTIER